MLLPFLPAIIWGEESSMKKLTLRHRRWLRNRQRRSLKERQRTKDQKQRQQLGSCTVDLWDQGTSRLAISLGRPTTPPTDFDFIRNHEEVCTILEGLRNKLHSASKRGATWVTEPNKKRRLASIASYIDFSRIENISTSAALVLAAEYARMTELVGRPPPLVNVDQWNINIVQKLLQLGFFEIVGINEEIEDRFLEDDDCLTLRFFSGSREETQKADESLSQLSEFLNPTKDIPEEIAIPFLSGISEAMINVSRHAYPSGHHFMHRHVGKWWITGTARRSERNFTVAIFDQGATIPVTYPELPLTDEIKGFLTDGLPGNAHRYRKDGRLIEAATRFGNTQTQQSHHGNGLPQMKEAIDAANNGHLRIWSRGGEYLYRSGGRHHRAWHPVSIGGTLIEWTINLA